MKLKTRKSGTKNRPIIYKEALGGMEVRKPAVAETLEPSGCQVIVGPGERNIEFAFESAVINQYENQIKRIVMETLGNLGAKDVRITIVNEGALDCAVRTGVKGAVFHAAGQCGNLPWRGATR